MGGLGRVEFTGEAGEGEGGKVGAGGDRDGGSWV